MIVFDRVSKVFGNGIKILDDFSLEVEEGEILVLLGKSGSGKTTVIRLINRLLEPTSGKIIVCGKEIKEQDPIELRRNIGYAVQQVGLFPHMTVEENIAIVPRLLKWDDQKIRARVDQLLEMVRLSPNDYRSRYPSELSGGQRQRVGVARALAADPSIILMDEPFGALDPVTREQVQNEFLELQSELKKTVIFVTHDIVEAVKLGTRVALLEKGKLVQVASPNALVEQQEGQSLDHFIGPQRFQVSLMTRTLRSILTDPLGQKPLNSEGEPRLFVYFSMMEAMNLFKSSRKDSLPLFDGKRYIGHFPKKKLSDAMMEIM